MTVIYPESDTILAAAMAERGYELVRKLGAGGFGMVYLARQMSVGREVAIKVILPEIAQDPLFEQRFEAEAKLAAQLEHPNIVPLHDYWRDKDRAYLVMRYLRGGSLKEALSDGPWDLARAAILLDQLASALDTAHRHGVIHRDLKSSNILLDEEGNGYLSDFGIAKKVTGTTIGTPTGAIMGSPAYMSPEQITGGEVTERSDIYSLGVMLYELVAGETPFGDADPATLLYKQINEPLPLVCDWRPELAPMVDLVIQKATSKAPAERYESALEMIGELNSGMESWGTVHREQLQQNREGATPPGTPSFMDELASERDQMVPLFVGRSEELTWLHGQLSPALAGQGRVIFVTGDAGSGKSSLLNHFSALSSAKIPDLLVASGSCNAFSGSGDPYLPFRHLLGMLTGDVEAQWMAGSISAEQARRLWDSSLYAIQAIVDDGPDLVNTLVPGKALLERTLTRSSDSATLVALRQRVQRAGTAAGDMEQPQLFEQVTTVLNEIGRERPMLLILDDLQWADSGSIDLLFQLGRSLLGSRILIACTHRSEEMGASRDENRRSVKTLLSEFRRIYGDVILDLDKSTGADFVDDLVNSEPNRLRDDFRRTLYQHTNGHPLFTVELMRELQERGDLARDDEGYWIEGTGLDWTAIPARVEGVIEARIGRLEEELREMLSIAAVEGESFTAQVVARVLQLHERQLLRTLSRELQKRHKLVLETQMERLGQLRLNHYRFVHQMFWRYLYNDLTDTERQLLHREIGEILEELYAGRTEEITIQLARHFDEAGECEKAATYLLAAGDQARSLHSHQEAIDHYNQALIHLEALDDDERIARTMMRLGLTYHNALDYRLAQDAYDEGFSKWQQLKPMMPKTPVEGLLRVHVAKPLSIDPAQIQDSQSADYCDQLFSGLVEESPDLEIVPDVAYRWQIDDAGRTYIFHLKEDVSWSDGETLEAADFKFAWQRVLDPANASSYAETLYDIKGAREYHQGSVPDASILGIQTPDDFTLIVELEQPSAYFLYLMSQPTARPVPRHAIELHDDRWTEPELLVCNGPFIFDGKQSGAVHRLVRNPRYHGTWKGNVYQIDILEELPDESWQEEAIQKYGEGELDFLHIHYPEETINRLRKRFGDHYVSIPQTFTIAIGFNPQIPPFDDVRVRQALVMAFDKDRFARLVLRGHTVPAFGGWIPPGIPGHSPGISLPYQPETARKLLADAGFPEGNGFPRAEMVMLANPHLRRDGDYLRGVWQDELGISVQVRYEPFYKMHELRRGDFPQIVWQAWIADYPDPDNFLRVAIGDLISHLEDQRYQELIDTARQEMDPRDRLNLYQEADKILMDEGLILPLKYVRAHYFIRPRVQHFPLSSQKASYWKDVVVDPIS